MLVALALPNAASATNTNYPQNTALLMTGPGIALVINAGSKSDALSVTGTTFTVTVGAGDTFTVRSVGPNPKTLNNDGGLSNCGIPLIAGDNQIVVTGPKVITFTPSNTVCAPSGGGQSPSVTLSAPNGGLTINSLTTYQVLWGSTGSNISSIKLSLSTDGGLTYPTVIASGLSNNGFYDWAVPLMATSTTARLRVEAIGGAGVLATSDSATNFTVQGTAVTTGGGGGGGGGGGATTTPATTTPAATTPGVFVDTTSTFPTGTHPSTQYSAAEKAAPAADPVKTGAYNATSAVAATPSIDVDKGILPPAADKTLPCTGGDLIKTAATSSVYYCGKNGKRYVFPTSSTFFTWFTGFGSVKTLTGTELAAVPLAGNVSFKPGTRMIKIQSDPKTYAVSRNGLLRWVKDEATAKALYGTDWNKKIDDIDPAFFINYQIGDPIDTVK